MTPATVTICVPVFNGARDLDEALWSARRQTLQTITILVVDDRSDDESVEIARRHAAEDERVVVHENERNLGLVGNWNRCIELAATEWLKFLFQDDVLARDCVERMVETAVEQDRRVVACARGLVFDGLPDDDIRRLADGTLAQRLAESAEARTYYPPEAVARLAAELVTANVVGEPSAVLLHRDVFETCGRFDPAFVQACDWEFWVRAGLRFGIHFENTVLAHFRVHDRAASLRNFHERNFQAFWLEPVMLLQKFLYEPDFALVREAAARTDPVIDLELQLARSIHRARLKARLLDRQAGGGRLGERLRLLVGDGPMPATVPPHQRFYDWWTVRTGKPPWRSPLLRRKPRE